MPSGFVSNALRLFAVLLALAASGQSIDAAQAQNNSASSATLNLQAVFDGLNKAAPLFKSISGTLEYTKVTVIVDDHSTETGRIIFEKSGGKSRVMLAFTAPAEKYVLFESGKVSIYRPKIAEVEVFSLANRKDLVEQFLLLGFGTSAAELQQAYDVSFAGETSLDGRRTAHLTLLPKSTGVASQLKGIELWLLPDTWQPLQQKFLEPSGDYLIARYSNLQHNSKIPAKDLRLPLKGNVRTVQR